MGISQLKYILFPKRCIVCDCVIYPDEEFCEDCCDVLKPIEGKLCKRCGYPKKHCECKKYAYHFRGFVAPFYNEGDARRAAYSYKFLHKSDSADFFARHIKACLTERFPDITFDCVTSVPMSDLRMLRGDFDHAGILALRTARLLGVPYTRLLRKVKKNKTQHHITSARERFLNVKNVYRAKKNGFANVLLVDDIKTTGASLDECARQLMLSGADNVFCATAVIAPCKKD